MNQERIWDEIANDWKKYRNERPIKEVKRFLEWKEGDILDLGCGTGRHFSAFDRDALITGVDFSSRMLELAAKRGEELEMRDRLRLIKANIFELPFGNEKFNYAIFISALHCIENYFDREKALKELYRVMKYNGKALISVWSKNHKIIAGREGEIKMKWKVQENDKELNRFYYIYNKEEILKLVGKVGFKIVEVKEEDNIFIEVLKKRNV